MKKNTFTDHLNQLVDQSRKSKNQIIKETGINRSTFFQILSGKRYPTLKQFGAVLSALAELKGGRITPPRYPYG